MEAVGRLTGGIAHDFNNLLTAIVGNLEMLQHRVADDERALRLAGAAFRAAMRGAKLTGQLLAFSRTQNLDLKAIDVNAVLRGADELLAQTVGPQIKLRLLPDPTIRPALADRNQLELALLNLAINARDAMPEGGRLTNCDWSRSGCVGNGC
jgi:signal transduction histidine kinase